ncbi:hypothetical protein [uncultured Thiodictyon sp.]|uniref:hypothetical protein n=1 Tax=uncultured Thiodictyon sp. TaxID=1846217 RepID=UPI0025E9A4E6|nr:hypothetical protein [uncultured Thiodictyon sp.]
MTYQARTDLSRLVNLPKPDPKAITDARATLERLEVELASLNRTFGGQRAARALDWESVRDALPRGSALLELRAFQPFDFKTGKWADPRWLALLIPADPGEGPPLRVFDLGPTATPGPVLARLRDGEAAAEPLVYQALFGPLDGAIKDYQTLFVAPDMDEFYRAWLGSGAQTEPAAALRKTQIDWIGNSDARKRDPKYWAPFVLVERG